MRLGEVYEVLWGLVRLTDIDRGWARFCEVLWGWVGLSEVVWGWVRLSEAVWGWERLNEVGWGGKGDSYLLTSLSIGLWALAAVFSLSHFYDGFAWKTETTLQLNLFCRFSSQMGSVDSFIFLGSTPETLPILPRKMAKYGQKFW